MRMIPRRLWLLLPLACLLLVAKGQRERYTVSFHLEAASEESERLVFSQEVGEPPRTRLFRRMPEVTHRDFTAFHSFPAADGTSGVVLQLNEEGTRRLAMATSTAQGSLMRVLVNGQGVDVLFIDRPIEDGRLTIWSGVPPEVIRELEKKLPRLAGRAQQSGETAPQVESQTTAPPGGRGYGEWPREDPVPSGFPESGELPELPLP